MLEDLIYKALTKTPEISDALVRYGGNPAVFLNLAAQDNAEGWNGKSQYPQIVYFVDQQYHPERKTSGVLQVDFLCDEDCSIVPEDMEDAIVGAMSELFLTEGSTTTCVLWNRSDSFEQPHRSGNSDEPKIAGETHSFDLYQFPSQITTNPDPIFALNSWTKHVVPNCVLIGYDDLPDLWRATDQRPAVYWRTTGTLSAVRTSHAVAWVDVTLVGHVVADSPTERQKWIQAIVSQMSLDGEIPLADGSPMIIKRIAYSSAANPIRDGQITVTGTYGILRNQTAQLPLKKISIK